MRLCAVRCNRFLVTLFLLSLLGGPLFLMGQEEKSSFEERFQGLHAALMSERYEQALAEVEALKRDFPDRPEPYQSAAKLFAEKGLHDLALENYRGANERKPGDFSILQGLAETLGKVDRNKEAVEVFEEMASLFPGDSEVISDLGWMYFKTFQLEKGVSLLEGALSRNPDEYGYMMTLGTLYSSLYDFDKAEDYYQQSIQKAMDGGDSYFASVAHYNLGILYHSFYRYSDAMTQTEESLARRDRASGHILRGELFQSRMNFSRALAEFTQARGKDDTPLSHLNFAYLYQAFGEPETALVYLKAVLDEGDLAWMYNYGINQEHFLMEIHKLQSDIYQDLSGKERRTPALGLRGWFSREWKVLTSWVRSRYHDFHFRRLSWRVSEELLEKENFLDGWWRRYQALRGYGRSAENYLSRARAFEESLEMPCHAFYQLEEGRERGNPDLLLAAAAGFDPLWERELISQTIQLLLRRHGRSLSREEEARLVTELYQINPAGVRTAGGRLPLQLILKDWAPREEGSLRWMARDLFRPLREGEEGFNLLLRRTGKGEMRYTLTDPQGGLVDSDTLRVDFSESESAGRIRQRLMAGLADRLYSPRQL